MFLLLALIFLCPFGCQSKNERVKDEIRTTVESVSPEAILDAVAELDLKYGESEEDLIVVLNTLPDAIAAFDPIEVRFRFKGSYMIVTERWVQHRTGLFISAPNEVVPPTTKHVIYEMLGDRIYLYQD